MQSNVPNFKFNPADLERLIKTRLAYYEKQEETFQGRGAIVSIYADWPHQFLAELQNKFQSGYAVADSLPTHLTSSFCRAYLIKPKHLQSEDIAAIRKEAEDEYRASLAADRANYVEREAQRLMEEKRVQAAERAAALEAKQLEQIKKDLAAAVDG